MKHTDKIKNAIEELNAAVQKQNDANRALKQADQDIRSAKERLIQSLRAVYGGKKDVIHRTNGRMYRYGIRDDRLAIQELEAEVIE